MSAQPLRKKGRFKALRARRRRNRPHPPSLETPWTRTGLNLAGGGRLVYTASWNWRVKMEIPAKLVCYEENLK